MDGQRRAGVVRAARRHTLENQPVGEGKAADGGALRLGRLGEVKRAGRIGVVRELGDAVGSELDGLG
jgi:hypothetical protein